MRSGCNLVDSGITDGVQAKCVIRVVCSIRSSSDGCGTHSRFVRGQWLRILMTYYARLGTRALQDLLSMLPPDIENEGTGRQRSEDWPRPAPGCLSRCGANY